MRIIVYAWWLLLAAGGASQGAWADTGTAWTAANRGLTAHASVTAIARDPADGYVLYAGVYGRDSLFTSVDGGTTWRQAGAGVVEQPVFSLVFDPHDSNLLWAGTADGLYRGARQAPGAQWHWGRVAEWPTAAAAYSLYLDAAGKLYAGGGDSSVWTLTSSRRWQRLAPLPDEPHAVLSVAAASPHVLLAGTDGDGLFVSRDAGRTWQVAPEIGETFVAALWVAPWDENILLARTRAGLFRSADGAATWQRTASELEVRIDAISADPDDKSIYLGLSTGELVRSTDGGITWRPWGAGVGRDGLFYTLTPASPAPAEQILFFAGTEHGFYRSDDGGLTWTQGAGLGTYRATALAQAADGTLYLGNQDGVYLSTDQGDSWQWRGDGLPPRAVLSLAISPHDAQVLYAATEGDGIYRSTDGGATWAPYAWDDHIIADVLPDPDLPQRIYARVAYERIYVSDDDGVTWTSRWDSMEPTTEIQSLAISPHDANVLFAGGATELYRSPDRALDWQRTGAELVGQSIFHVSVDAHTPDTVYAGATKGLYRSDDGGDTWRRWGVGLEDITVTALVLDPANPQVAFAGTKDRGVYGSSDGGATWRPAGLLPEGQTVHALALAPGGRRLFAATDRGFQRLDFVAARLPGSPLPGRSLPGSPSSGRELLPPRYGVHTLAVDARTLPLAQAVGADTVVQLFPWREIEPTKGQFVWQAADEAVAGAEYYGLNLIVRLDHPPEWARAKNFAPGAPPVDLVEYSQWVRRVVERYKGKVPAYIIWNEPNLALEWSGLPPEPEAYVELLKVGDAAVKAADPQALVVGGGLAPTNTQNDEALDDRLFLQAMYDHGAAPYFDVLGVHAYGFGHPPADPRGAHDGLNLARTADLREVMVRSGDGDKPVWITEMGWTTRGNAHSAWQEVTPAEQAAYLPDALALIRREWPWVELVTVWNLGGEDNPEWGGYSLLAEGGTPRPAYRALQAYLRAQGHGELRPVQPPAAVSAVTPPKRATESTDSPGLLRSPAPLAIQVLAPDAIIHLGDNRLPAPWMPLHRDRNPSPEWRGVVYVREPGDIPWQLSLRVMQSNFWSNRVWVNGKVLPEPLPVTDFSKSWVSTTAVVPPGLLKPGPNEIRITIAHATPLIQDKGFSYDKLQFKDIVLQR